MTLELKVHPSFFKEFATKTWISPYEIIKELIENAFDEDATSVIVTVLRNGNVIIEDDVGMNSESIDKFLILGSPHKAEETLSPKLKRIRTGRYGTGRLSFLTSFEKMKIKTKLDSFYKSLIIDANTLESLILGHAKLQELRESTLKRNGTEIVLMDSKITIDEQKLFKEIKKLSILRYPMFEVFLKFAEDFKEWDIGNSHIVKSPDIQGYRIIVDIESPKISGEIVIAKRPLSSDEKGIAILVGNHVVMRSTFGFDNKLSRVTGYVKCNGLTSRFADKSALIEDDIYLKFNQTMKSFIINQVLPSLTEYEDVLITREESKIYKEIDKVMGQAVLEMLEPTEEIQGFESIEISGDDEYIGHTAEHSNPLLESLVNNTQLNKSTKEQSDFNITDQKNYPSNLRAYDSAIDLHNGLKMETGKSEDVIEQSITNKSQYPPISNNKIAFNNDTTSLTKDLTFSHIQSANDPQKESNSMSIHSSLMDNPSLIVNNLKQDLSLTEHNNIQIRKTIRKPILKKTFTLKKIGYKVVPYEDDTDSRYSFTNENVVFVNKAHPTYKVESERGEEFLFRHITNIVAEVVVGSKYPESKDILEIQNKLISEAIKIHDYSILKK